MLHYQLTGLWRRRQENRSSISEQKHHLKRFRPFSEALSSAPERTRSFLQTSATLPVCVLRSRLLQDPQPRRFSSSWVENSGFYVRNAVPDWLR